MGYQLLQGDCIKRMSEIPAGSVDMVLCDPPYGTTACTWDAVIPLDQMWLQLCRLVRPDGAIIFTCAQPFTTTLIASNMAAFRYPLVWNKQFAANFVQAKRMPLRTHEDVMVFCTSGKSPRYFPQMTKRDKPISKGGNKQSEAIPIRRTATAEAFEQERKTYTEKHPISILDSSNRGTGDRGSHPTQKPVALMEYLISTYSQRDDMVLDFTMGSGTTGVACANLSRRFTGIELDEQHFATANTRIAAAYASEFL